MAQILGIQALPSSPLLPHLGIHPDYLRDYVALGLTESANGRPFGLPGLQTLSALGHVQTGRGTLTADYPVAIAFDDGGVTTYVVYNFADQPRTVRYSDGQIVDAAPGSFTVVRN